MPRSSPALLVALAALAAAPASALAAEQTLDASGTSDTPGVFAAPDGTVRAVSGDAPGGPSLRVAVRAPGAEAFGVPRTLVALTAGDRFPRAGFDASGRAVVVMWRTRKPYRRARVTLQEPGGSFSAPVTLSRTGHTAGLPSVAVADDGSALAAWPWYDGKKRLAQYAIRPAGGRFGAATDATPSGDRDGFTPEIAVSQNGHAVLAYEAESTVYAATGTLAGGLAKPQAVGTYRPNYGSLSVATDDAGRAVVAWEDVRYVSSTDRGPTRFKAAVADPDGQFAPAQQLATTSDEGGTAGPTTALQTDGTALVSWAADESLNVASAAPRAGFSAATRVAKVGDYSIDPVLAADPRGGAALAWTLDRQSAEDENGGSRLLSTVQVARRAAAGTFTAPVALSAGDEQALRPSLAVAPDGTVVTGWLQSPEGFGVGNAKVNTLAP